MAEAQAIDGKAIARQLRESLARQVAKLGAAHHIQPGLAVVLVGDDPASQVYVRNKGQQTIEIGMKSVEHRLPVSTTAAELLALIDQLNKDEQIDGILVQLPLPAHLPEALVINAIDPAKDVDGFHLINVGKLATGQPGLVPCTPYGCMILLKSVFETIGGKKAVVIGRSNIVGKPMAQLLLAANCTVTIAHSRTMNLPDVVRDADIVIAAVGQPEMVKGSWLKPGAVVIDVGMNRIHHADGVKTKLVGDVDYASAINVAGAITPVPGGVGPMTIACLLRNTLVAALLRRKLEIPHDLITAF
jgi:methylenetetrahydrofolate dehydrogenase (NADP+) / methenyltetrahydrofolate cyclohydrolase